MRFFQEPPGLGLDNFPVGHHGIAGANLDRIAEDDPIALAPPSFPAKVVFVSSIRSALGRPMRRVVNPAILVSILLLTGALAASAVLGVRETAKRAKCTNNLRVLGMAIFNCQQANDRFWFPTATVSETNLPPEERLSYLVEILPFVEAAPRPPYDKMKAWHADENRPQTFKYHLHKTTSSPLADAYWGHYRLWNCPSSSYEAIRGSFSVTHYVGIAGIGNDAASLPANSPNIGLFGYDRVLHSTDIRNELAQTLMVVETSLANGPWVASGYATVRGAEQDRIPYFAEGGQFGGFHARGANALFADSSVRFLSDGMSWEILEGMCKIAPSQP
jgi:prepilin-type processing-associated H-X9-DG protein